MSFPHKSIDKMEDVLKISERDFEVRFLTLADSQGNVCQVGCFTWLFIIAGEGAATVNQQHYQFQAGDVLLVSPGCQSKLFINEPVRMMEVRFNEQYVLSNFEGMLPPTVDNEPAEMVLTARSKQVGCVRMKDMERSLTGFLIRSVELEFSSERAYSFWVTESMISAIIVVVVRNLFQIAPEILYPLRSARSIPEIMEYIHQHIGEPDKLNAQHIGTHFHISASYLSAYFKKHTGDTLGRYIINHKLRLIETMLSCSDLRMNEIAAQLRFTDGSHFYRFYKKYRRINPSEFRKAKQAV